ncbi:MAG: EAL domain-containing protein [Rhodospirillales bacterium]|nr:EAL domain-containing protein [Rhodospirillales bacterium]
MYSPYLIKWLNDISISKKLYFTIGAMAMLICLELFALYFSLNTLSSLRAYVGAESLWSKAQKDAVFHLYRYGVSHTDLDYDLFVKFMKVPIGDEKTRQALRQTKPDIEAARQGFLEGRNHPDDINGMIDLFINFNNVYYIRKAMTIWGNAEPIVTKLFKISDELHNEIESESPSQKKIDDLLKSVYIINQELTALEDDFSYTLGEGSRWLEGFVLKLLFSIAITVETTGLILTISVSRNIQKGLTEIIRAANSFAKGDYGTRARVFSQDEIGVVADAFNQMSGELQSRVSELAEVNQQLRQQIVERERTEAKLRRTFALLGQHVNNTPLGVIEWEQESSSDDAPRVHRWSGRSQAIFGWTSAEVSERSAEAFGLFFEGDAERAADARRDLTEGRCPRNTLSLRCYTKQRRVLHCQWYNSVLHLKESGKITILSLIEDVTEQVAALENVHRLAHHDILTGLPNRSMLHDRLGQALAGARRHRQGVAVMMIDLDHFKNVNDALGHTIGDQLLKGVAARLCSRLRASDTLARVGGDEFVLIQPDLVDQKGASIMAHKLIDALAEPFFVDGNRLHAGISVGITIFPHDGAEPDGLLRNADMALYRAKRDGRGQYRHYSPDMDVELKASRSIENGLRQAIEHGSLTLHYQPTFGLNDGRMQGVEALIRWPHPRGGFVPPANFIPVAEMSGLIVPLGEWILRQACHQAQVWRADGRRLRVAVNLSAVQLRQPDFASLIERVLGESGLAGPALELEVTESVFLDPSKSAITRALYEVAELGVGLAIDDFGTGYSSLGYLKRFPFTRIKIDASFVRDIGAEADADAIVTAIIALGRGLDKAVTAEGVETDLQLNFLRAHACDEAQGYLLAQPQPAHEIAEETRVSA